MLAELKNVRQEGGTLLRRWFQDDVMELIVWYDDGRLTGFQICYPGPDSDERALTWRPGRGFSHARVDSGEDRPDKNMTPILVKDGEVPWAMVQEEMARRTAGLEPELRDYVLGAFARRAP